MIAFVIQDNKSFTTFCKDSEGNERKDLKTKYRNPVFVYSKGIVVVINKYNKSDYFRYDTHHENGMTATDCNPSTCPLPLFVPQMKASLFQTIDGVITTTINPFKQRLDYYVVLFNMEGSPKLCLTEIGRKLSEEVTHN